MSIVDLPAGVVFRSANWRQQGGIIYNRSEFTGRTRAVRIGPSARWFCDLEVVPTASQAQLRNIRQWLSFSYATTVGFRLPAVEVAQASAPVPATCTVNGASQLGFTLSLAGLATGVTNLANGSLISIALPNGDEQLCALAAPLTGDGSGVGIATLATPLRQSPSNGATVRLHTPVGVMRLRDPIRWAATPGTVYEIGTISAEEWF
jgi:hypothetical protein